MSDEKMIQATEEEDILVKKLFTTEKLFVILSERTKMPFVMCDSETFDDQILVYEKPEYVEQMMKTLREEKNPVVPALISLKDRFTFFANMATFGVNCIVFNCATEEESRIQLDRMVKTPEGGKTPDGQPWIANSALHLTAAYFMQAIERDRTETEEVKAMREEMIAHYSSGNYIIYFNEKNQVPLMRFPNGDAYHPIFTDRFEASKFKLDSPIKMGVIPAARIPGVLAPEAKGVVINPTGVCLHLPIIRKMAQQVPTAAPEGVPGENDNNEIK